MATVFVLTIEDSTTKAVHSTYSNLLKVSEATKLLGNSENYATIRRRMLETDTYPFRVGKYYYCIYRQLVR